MVGSGKCSVVKNERERGDFCTVDLFDVLYDLVYAACLDVFSEFSTTSEYKTLSRMVCLREEEEEKMLVNFENRDGKGTMVRNALGLEDVLKNGRLRCIFWMFLYHERAHESFSFYLHVENVVKPAFENVESDVKGFWHTLVELCNKHVHVHCPAPISTVSEVDFSYLELVHSLVVNHEADVEIGRKIMDKLEHVLESVKASIKVNEFVKFMASDSFKELAYNYNQIRISSRSNVLNIHDNSSDSSNSSNLHEIFQSLKVVTHRPQRKGSNTFQDLDFVLGNFDIIPISAILSFQLVPCASEPSFVVDRIFQHEDVDGDPHGLPENLQVFFEPLEIRFHDKKQESKLYCTTLGTPDKKFYGAFLIRYCRISDSNVNRKTKAMYGPVGIAIFSRFPILNTLRTRLQSMHLSALHQKYRDNCNWVPDATLIGQLLAPISSVYQPQVDTLSGITIPHLDFSLQELFNILSLNTIVDIYCALLLEKKIVFTCSFFDILTKVIEGFQVLLQPLSWSHVVAPLLPKSMLECIYCPTPYLFGIHSSYLLHGPNLSTLAHEHDFILVHLDARTTIGLNQLEKPTRLLRPFLKKLKAVLRVDIHDHVSNSYEETECWQSNFPQANIRAYFHQFTKSILRNVHDYCFTLTDECDQVIIFDKENYLQKLVPHDMLSFYTTFFTTQMFSHYISTPYSSIHKK